jgi:MYXO-CTERM domain-containing protein
MNSAGYEPISGNDYRPDEKDLPNICKTNGANPDVWADDNTTYPSDADKNWYYMGYAHAVDWVKLTVDVKAAGKYYVSSYWASAGDMWGLSIWFNDGTGTPDAQRPKDGINKTGLIEMAGTSDYHKWKKYPNFATVDLSAGLQVMTFHLEKHDHLQYGFLQFDPVDGVTGLGGGGGSGGTGTGAGGSGTGGSALGGTGGATGVDPSAGTPATSGSSTGGTASSAGTSATPSGSNAGGSASTPGLGNTGTTNSNQDSSCTIGHNGSRWPAALGLLLAGYALLRRRVRG